MKIYSIWLMVVAFIYRLARRVQVDDKDLARQMRRASASAALNLAEGMHGRGGNRIARFHDAMGSARETRACLDVCVAARFVERTVIEAELDRIDHVIAGLYNLCHKRRS
jgi:four helix bundle protein